MLSRVSPWSTCRWSRPARQRIGTVLPSLVVVGLLIPAVRRTRRAGRYPPNGLRVGRICLPARRPSALANASSAPVSPYARPIGAAVCYLPNLERLSPGRSSPTRPTPDAPGVQCRVQVRSTEHGPKLTDRIDGDSRAAVWEFGPFGSDEHGSNDTSPLIQFSPVTGCHHLRYTAAERAAQRPAICYSSERKSHIGIPGRPTAKSIAFRSSPRQRTTLQASTETIMTEDLMSDIASPKRVPCLRRGGRLERP
jgi:hypothetical protein